jgi:hypothetical protein
MTNRDDHVPFQLPVDDECDLLDVRLVLGLSSLPAATITYPSKFQFLVVVPVFHLRRSLARPKYLFIE